MAWPWLVIAQSQNMPPLSQEWLAFIAAVVTGAGVFFALRGDLKSLQKQVEKLEKIESGEICGRLETKVDRQRDDMDAMDDKFTQMEQEWRNYYGGSVRNYIDTQRQRLPRSPRPKDMDDDHGPHQP